MVQGAKIPRLVSILFNVWRRFIYLAVRLLLFLWPAILLFLVVTHTDLIVWDKLSRQTKFVGALFYIGYLLIIALWKIPDWQSAGLDECCTPKELGELRNTYRKTIAEISGGIALLAGLYFTWGNLTTAQQGQITERFTKAVDQLGARDTAIRLGGIYALERIARDSREDHGSIMEILTAYVRNNAPRESSVSNSIDRSRNKNFPKSYTSNMKPREDIQACLTVIGRRELRADEGPFDLQGTDLRGANLVAANLRRTNFSKADLSFIDSRRANLAQSTFSSTMLREAVFRGANLKEAILAGAEIIRADLRSANLQGAVLENIKADEVQFWGANLEGATLINVDLSKAIGLSSDQLIGVNKHGQVILPEYLKR